MIGKNVCKFCKDDLSIIENYDKAINDNINVWECHHRLETELNVSRQYLIDNNIYYNRPANELILLTNYEHNSIHKHHLGKHHSEETKQKMSESHKGQTAWNKGIPCTEETKHKHSKANKGQIPWNKGMNKEEMEIYKANKRAA